MRDGELRERFSDAHRNRVWLEERIKVLEGAGFSVNLCSSCEHDTIHQYHPRATWYGDMVTYVSGQSEDFHRCLNCGKDWVYSMEAVAREYKP